MQITVVSLVGNFSMGWPGMWGPLGLIAQLLSRFKDLFIEIGDGKNECHCWRGPGRLAIGRFAALADCWLKSKRSEHSDSSLYKGQSQCRWRANSGTRRFRCWRWKEPAIGE